ncbi:MAG: SPOR domain-containing protein [Acidobacteriaceae bacterium]
MKTYQESERASRSDTEITLGMKSILGIFFGLALICGVFFGFGYSVGRGNNSRLSIASGAASPKPGATLASDIKTIVEPSSTAQQAKPAAGAPLAPPLLAATSNASATTAPQSTSTQPAPAAAPTPGKAVPAAYAVSAPATTTATPANIMVQIAAVSRRGDADVLVTALQGRGYQVSVRTEPSDRLLHVQVGPFATRDQAMAMRTRLLNDGYNAILK